MRLPKLRELKEAITSLISRPYTAFYPFVKPKIPDGFRGKPQFYEEDCVGCGACAEVCPSRAIEIVDDKESRLRTLTHRQDLCIFCGQCERACITEKGIKLTKEYELSTYDRDLNISQSKKPLLICEGCGAALGCVDHFKFLALKLGPLAFTNPALLLARHDDLKALEQTLPKDSPHKRAAAQLKITCPKCRRSILIEEQW